jgi:hypothetical protein
MGGSGYPFLEGYIGWLMRNNASRKGAGSISCEGIEFFSIYLTLLGVDATCTEISNKDLPEVKARTALKDDNHIAICEPVI